MPPGIPGPSLAPPQPLEGGMLIALNVGHQLLGVAGARSCLAVEVQVVLKALTGCQVTLPPLVEEVA